MTASPQQLFDLVEKHRLNLPEDLKYTDEYEWSKNNGDVVRIEMLDHEGRSIFGAIEQVIEPYA